MIDLGLVVSLGSGGVWSIQCCHFPNDGKDDILSTGIVLAFKNTCIRKRITLPCYCDAGDSSPPHRTRTERDR